MADSQERRGLVVANDHGQPVAEVPDPDRLSAELSHAGYQVEDVTLPAVCTMRWASSYLTSPSRRLSDCCASAGIDLRNAHSALGDALATAELLSTYLTSAHHQPAWQDTLEAA